MDSFHFLPQSKFRHHLPPPRVVTCHFCPHNPLDPDLVLPPVWCACSIGTPGDVLRQATMEKTDFKWNSWPWKWFHKTHQPMDEFRWIWQCSTSLAPLASHSPDSETKSKIEGCNLQKLATKKVPWSANEQLGIWWLRPNKLKYSGDLGKLCSKGLHLLWTRSLKQLEAPVFSYEWLLNTFQHHSLPHCSSYVASLIHGSLQRLPTFTYQMDRQKSTSFICTPRCWLPALLAAW